MSVAAFFWSMIGDRASKVVLPKAVVGLWLLVWWVMLWLGSTGPAWGLGLGDRAGDPLCCAATSTLTAYYDYDAFGSTLRATGPAAAANSYRFSTKPVDEETGLVYYGYRWYHPELGRWLSRDPIGEAGGLNLYGMVGNDPVNGVDVLGLEVLSDAEWETAKSKFSGLPEWGKVVGHFDDCNRLWKFHPVHQIWVRFGEAREGSNKCCSKDNFFRGPRGFDPRVGDDPWLVRLIDSIVGSPKQIVDNKPNLSESLNPGADLAQMRDNAMRAGGDALANAGVVLEVVTPSPTDALLAAGFLHGMMRGAAKRPLWSSTGNKTSVENAFGHWKKHGNEFPEFQNAKQYAEGAHKFMTNPPKGTLTKTRPNGDKLFYNPNSNTFGVQTADGAPRTMFRPSGDGMKYWNKQ